MDELHLQFHSIFFFSMNVWEGGCFKHSIIHLTIAHSRMKKMRANNPMTNERQTQTQTNSNLLIFEIHPCLNPFDISRLQK